MLRATACMCYKLLVTLTANSEHNVLTNRKEHFNLTSKRKSFIREWSYSFDKYYGSLLDVYAHLPQHIPLISGFE